MNSCRQLPAGVWAHLLRMKLRVRKMHWLDHSLDTDLVVFFFLFFFLTLISFCVKAPARQHGRLQEPSQRFQSLCPPCGLEKTSLHTLPSEQSPVNWFPPSALCLPFELEESSWSHTCSLPGCAESGGGWEHSGHHRPLVAASLTTAVCECEVSRIYSLRPHGLYVACQAPPSMGFSRQEYWSGLPFPSPGTRAGTTAKTSAVSVSC